MKKTTTMLVLVLLAASNVFAQRPFSSVALENVHNHEMIVFTLPSEANTSYYRIEAGNDKNNFEIIGTIKSSGNSVLSKTYHYEVFTTGYKYYRIGRVGMNGSMQYSQVMDAPQKTMPVEPVFHSDKQSIANGQL